MHSSAVLLEVQLSFALLFLPSFPKIDNSKFDNPLDSGRRIWSGRGRCKPSDLTARWRHSRQGLAAVQREARKR